MVEKKGMKWRQLPNDEIAVLRECIGLFKGPGPRGAQLAKIIYGSPFYQMSSEELEQLESFDKSLESSQRLMEAVAQVEGPGGLETAPVFFTETQLMALGKAAVNYYRWVGRAIDMGIGDAEEQEAKKVLLQRAVKKLLGWRGRVPRGLWRLIAKMRDN